MQNAISCCECGDLELSAIYNIVIYNFGTFCVKIVMFASMSLLSLALTYSGEILYTYIYIYAFVQSYWCNHAIKQRIFLQILNFYAHFGMFEVCRFFLVILLH